MSCSFNREGVNREIMFEQIMNKSGRDACTLGFELNIPVKIIQVI